MQISFEHDLAWFSTHFYYTAQLALLHLILVIRHLSTEDHPFLRTSHDFANHSFGSSQYSLRAHLQSTFEFLKNVSAGPYAHGPLGMSIPPLAFIQTTSLLGVGGWVGWARVGWAGI